MTESLEIKHKVLVIVKSKQNIIDTASFVVKREFEIALFEDAKEALAAIQNHKPKVVCISLNVPLSKLPAYCHYVENTLHIPVVIFAEKPDRNTSSLLLKTRMKNTMFGHVTGPSMLLKLRAVIRAQEAKLISEKNQKEFGNHSADSQTDSDDGRVLNFQQNRPSGTQESHVIKIGDKGERAQSKENGSLSFQNSEATTKNFGFQLSTSGKNQSTGFAFDPRQSYSKEGSRPKFQNMKFTPAAYTPSFTTPWNHPLSENDEGSQGFESLSRNWDNGLETQPTKPISGQTNQNSFTPDELANSLGSDDWSVFAQKINSDSNFQKQSFLPQISDGLLVNPNLPYAPSSPQFKAFSEVSQFLKGIALKREEVQHITGFVKERVNKVGVIPVVSEEMPGYLVVNYPNEDELVEEFLAEVILEIKKNHPLVTFLTQTPIIVSLNRFLITDWIQERAQVLVRSARGTNELLVSFVGSAEKIPKLLPASAELLVLEFQGFCFDHPLNFETYLHLKTNNKVLKYTSRGDKAEEARFQRIKNILPNGICIKDRDEARFKEFFLTQSLFCMHAAKEKKEAA